MSWLIAVASSGNFYNTVINVPPISWMYWGEVYVWASHLLPAKPIKLNDWTTAGHRFYFTALLWHLHTHPIHRDMRSPADRQAYRQTVGVYQSHLFLRWLSCSSICRLTSRNLDMRFTCWDISCTSLNFSSKLRFWSLRSDNAEYILEYSVSYNT